jgi:hypothetical protein
MKYEKLCLFLEDKYFVSCKGHPVSVVVFVVVVVVVVV